jgi:hypothetical protein
VTKTVSLVLKGRRKYVNKGSLPDWYASVSREIPTLQRGAQQAKNGGYALI